MIPGFNMQEFVSAAKKKAAELEKEDKKKKTSCSQQALANQMVSQSMASPAAAGMHTNGQSAAPVQ